jgi:hypothetical protein
MTVTIMAVLLSAARTGSITTGPREGADMDMVIEDPPPICC